ncbi:hypothetical protein [Burkholderia sp. BCC1998]|uniref:hypothetical protein n=1 Tax=Burkholderia sp. BCC1998 TaxID=2817447 RepID=UPI0021502098|nr:MULTISPECIES: hypothetical protein [unclassified Burkholderia]MCR4471840.1 hypothetical protein [Burkholderia sp. SCN-KJ]
MAATESLLLGVDTDAIDQFVDAEFAGNDAVDIGKNRGHDRRTRGNRLNHVLQTIFDPFRDLDFSISAAVLLTACGGSGGDRPSRWRWLRHSRINHALAALRDTPTTGQSAIP